MKQITLSGSKLMSAETMEKATTWTLIPTSYPDAYLSADGLIVKWCHRPEHGGEVYYDKNTYDKLIAGQIDPKTESTLRMKGA